MQNIQNQQKNKEEHSFYNKKITVKNRTILVQFWNNKKIGGATIPLYRGLLEFSTKMKILGAKKLKQTTIL